MVQIKLTFFFFPIIISFCGEPSCIIDFPCLSLTFSGAVIWHLAEIETGWLVQVCIRIINLWRLSEIKKSSSAHLYGQMSLDSGFVSCLSCPLPVCGRWLRAKDTCSENLFWDAGASKLYLIPASKRKKKNFDKKTNKILRKKKLKIYV